MADDADLASEREEMIRSKGLENTLSRMQYESKRLAELEEKGIQLKCKYCDEPLIGHTSRFCDVECKREYEYEQEAITTGRVTKL